MIKYIHGSEDSLDKDVYYVFETIPDIKECRKFCSENITENRNIIVIENGIVSDCFIGTTDEINNGLIDTYPLHEQEYELIVKRKVQRNIPIKMIRATRGILSLISKSRYRTEIKKSLRSNWQERINCLSNIKFEEIDFNNLGKGQNEIDILKVIAFQIGQSLGLLENKEFYTKNQISNEYILLKPFLYRKDMLNLKDLNYMKDILVKKLNEIDIIELGENKVKFIKYEQTYELKHEKQII